MKNEFSMLNDVKIDIDEFQEVKLDNNDEIKRRMKLKIKGRKSIYKKITVVASFLVLLCGLAMSNEVVWANVEKSWYGIQKVLNLKNEEVVGYKYEINKSIESKNIKVTYKNLMIDDGNLLVEIDVDNSKFDPFKDFTKKEQKEWSVEKWGDKELSVISIDNMETYIDGEKRGILNSGQTDYAKKSNDSNGMTNIVSVTNLNEKEDVYNVHTVGKEEFPYTINKNKTYNIKLNLKKIYRAPKMAENEKSDYTGVVKGDWSVELPVKGEDLIKATTNYDNYEIDRNIKINIGGVDKEIRIDSLHISPIYVKSKYTIDLDTYHINDNYDEDKYYIEIRLENEKGEEYQTQYMTSNYNEENARMIVVHSNIFKDSKKIKVTPIVTNINTHKSIEQESITIDLDRNNLNNIK